MNTLYTVVRRVREDAERLALTRLSLQFIRECAREGLILDQVTPDTRCSPELLRQIGRAADELIAESRQLRYQ